MLSPKHLKPTYTKNLIASRHKGPLLPMLDDHICLVDDAAVVSALDGIEVPSLASKYVFRGPRSHEMLSVFLNDCVRAINSAYDHLARERPRIGEFTLKPREKRWYPQLHFHCNEEATYADGINAAAPLKPDVVGLHEQVFNPKAFPCCWGRLDAKNPQIRIPVEVKKAWPELISQAEIYARALRSAALVRVFRLVFGYNQATCDFRVLIFHNGGLAASVPCNLRSASGRKDVVRMLWPVLLWQDAEDAGFPSFTDGDQLALYRNDEADRMARCVAILSRYLSSPGRGTLIIKAQLGLLTNTPTQGTLTCVQALGDQQSSVPANTPRTPRLLYLGCSQKFLQRSDL